MVVAGALRESLGDETSVTFIGAQRGIEQRLVPQAGYPLVSLRISGLKGRGIAAKLGAATAAGWAVIRCWFWMYFSTKPRHRPDAV